MTLDLKPFFLHATYSDEDDREMIKMLWGQCVPKAFYDFIKKPDNSEHLLSQNVSFKRVKALISKFAADGHYWQGLKNCFTAYYSTYQYVYSMLFPKYYTQNNKFGMKNRIKFALCYERWRSTQQQLGKNPFNFNVENKPDNFTVESKVERHEFEQKLIVIDVDVEFRADVPGTKKKCCTAPSTAACDLCLCSHYGRIVEFDQKYSLPKVIKKAPKINEKKLAPREQKKKYLIEQLNKNTEKMKQIKKCK